MRSLPVMLASSESVPMKSHPLKHSRRGKAQQRELAEAAKSTQNTPFVQIDGADVTSSHAVLRNQAAPVPRRCVSGKLPALCNEQTELCRANGVDGNSHWSRNNALRESLPCLFWLALLRPIPLQRATAQPGIASKEFNFERICQR